MPKPVYLMTVHEAHQEYSSLIDQIRAKYELLDSGECGSVGTPAFNAECSELANLMARMSELCKYWRGLIPNKRYWKLSLSHRSFNCWSLLNNSPAIQCCENIQESLQTCCQETASSWNSPSIWTHTTVSLRWTSEIFWAVSCNRNIV